MTDMMKDKVVVVTGSGGGIGREFALLMAAEGAKVVVNDIGASVSGEGKDAGPAQKVVDEIRAKGGQAVANTDSVATWMSANAIIKTAIDNFGRIDCVVNNAGILRDRMFFKMNPEEWSAVIDVHLNGTFYVSRAAATYFREQESGAYVHMTSTSGLIGNIGQANYGAAKLGITALSKMIAMDMARYHVRSNCIAPFAWSRMIGSIPAGHARSQGARGKTQDHGSRQDRADGGVSVQRCGQGRERTGVRRARQRNLPHEPAAPIALGASRWRLDRAEHRRACDSCDEGRFLRPRPFTGRVQLGPCLRTEALPQRTRRTQRKTSCKINLCVLASSALEYLLKMQTRCPLITTR